MMAADTISVRRGGRLVLNRLSIAVRPGKLTVVVGPNGAGKSTLMAALTGLVQPEQGTVTLDGQSIGAIPRKDFARRVSVLQQRFHSTFPFKSFEIVALGRMPHEGRESQTAVARYVSAAMSATETTHLADQPCDRLSGGEQQRVFLARAIAQIMPLPAEQPRYLLLDEPTASLDLRHQAATLAFAKDVAAAGAGVLAVLHDLNLAATYADEIAVLADGSVAARGTAEEVLTAEILTPVYRAPLSVFPDPETGRPVVLPADPRIASGPGAAAGSFRTDADTLSSRRTIQ